MAEIYTDGGVSVGTGATGYAYPVMPYAPYGFGGGYGNNGGFFNGDGIWAIILFAMIFGNNGWGFGGNGGFGGAGNMLYDINTNTNRGFDNLAIHNEVDEVQSTLANGFTNIANSFADAEVARCNSTTALLQAINGVQAAQQSCCFENRLATQDLKATVISENCADREALSNGIRDIISSNTANTQAILDKLCQQELDAKNDLISQLRSQVSMADLRASQAAQTAQILAGQTAEVDALYNRLSNCPVPSTPVYGRVPIFTCNGGCGCGSIQ